MYLYFSFSCTSSSVRKMNEFRPHPNLNKRVFTREIQGVMDVISYSFSEASSWVLENIVGFLFQHRSANHALIENFCITLCLNYWFMEIRRRNESLRGPGKAGETFFRRQNCSIYSPK